MFEKFKALALLPVLVSNLYSMYGVLFLNWSVADLFFWFWCEFALTGITMIVLTLFWVHADKASHPNMIKLAPLLTSFSFLLINGRLGIVSRNFWWARKLVCSR